MYGMQDVWPRVVVAMIVFWHRDQGGGRTISKILDGDRVYTIWGQNIVFYDQDGKLRPYSVIDRAWKIMDKHISAKAS